ARCAAASPRPSRSPPPSRGRLVGGTAQPSHGARDAGVARIRRHGGRIEAAEGRSPPPQPSPARGEGDLGLAGREKTGPATSKRGEGAGADAGPRTPDPPLPRRPLRHPRP